MKWIWILIKNLWSANIWNKPKSGINTPILLFLILLMILLSQITNLAVRFWEWQDRGPTGLKTLERIHAVAGHGPFCEERKIIVSSASPLIVSHKTPKQDSHTILSICKNIEPCWSKVSLNPDLANIFYHPYQPLLRNIQVRQTFATLSSWWWILMKISQKRTLR